MFGKGSSAHAKIHFFHGGKQHGDGATKSLFFPVEKREIGTTIENAIFQAQILSSPIARGWCGSHSHLAVIISPCSELKYPDNS